MSKKLSYDEAASQFEFTMKRKGYFPGFQIEMPDSLNNFEFLTIWECLVEFKPICIATTSNSFITISVNLPRVIEGPDRLNFYFRIRYEHEKGFFVEMLKVICLDTFRQYDYKFSFNRQIPTVDKVRARFGKGIRHLTVNQLPNE